MPHTYTPGLRVTERTLLQKSRLLPIPGNVLVHEGQAVEAETVLARTELPGRVHTCNVVKTLGIMASEIRSFMLKKEGERIEAGEPLAENRPLIKWLKTRVPSPIQGTVEHVSEVTGQVHLREPPRPLEMKAHVRGHVTQILAGEGAVVECRCSLVQGIFGVGGERVGAIAVPVQSPEEVLSEGHITSVHRGQVVVGGSKVDVTALAKAAQIGVSGIVVGGIDDIDVRRLIGHDVGVAITGTEAIGLSLIVTEGFGRIPMAGRTFDLLRNKVGLVASINGSTQIRAGVVRPEVIIPLEETSGMDGETNPSDKQGLSVGDAVRIIRAPYFGALGWVKELPPEPREIPTESRVRILVVVLDDGSETIIPRANVEIIEM